MASETSRLHALLAERGEIARFAITLAIVGGVVAYVQSSGGATWAPLSLSLRVAGVSTVLTLVVGVGLAVLLQWRRTPARDLVDALTSVPLVLPHLAISGPLLALCVAQYWSVLDPDIERHFQLATAFYFATMSWLYVKILAADGVFETGPDAAEHPHS